MVTEESAVWTEDSGAIMRTPPQIAAATNEQLNTAEGKLVRRITVTD